MSTPAKLLGTAKSAAQLLEECKNRHQLLIQRQHKIEVELEAARRQYEEAKAEAVREFGTGDLEELRALYSKIESQNELAVLQCVKELDALETAITDAEEQLVS